MNLICLCRQSVLSPISLLLTVMMLSTKLRFRHLRNKVPINFSMKGSDSNNAAIGDPRTTTGSGREGHDQIRIKANLTNSDH